MSYWTWKVFPLWFFRTKNTTPLLVHSPPSSVVAHVCIVEKASCSSWGLNEISIVVTFQGFLSIRTFQNKILSAYMRGKEHYISNHSSQNYLLLWLYCISFFQPQQQAQLPAAANSTSGSSKLNPPVLIFQHCSVHCDCIKNITKNRNLLWRIRILLFYEILFWRILLGQLTLLGKWNSPTGSIMIINVMLC